MYNIFGDTCTCVHTTCTCIYSRLCTCTYKESIPTTV